MASEQLSFTDLLVPEPAKKPVEKPRTKTALSLVSAKTPSLSLLPTEQPRNEWLCIYLPQLATEVFVHDSSNPALLVVTSNERGRPVVHNAMLTAVQHGIYPGLKLPSAYSLCADIDVRQRQPEKEQQRLEALAACLYQFSSQVSLQAPNKLLLEIAASYSLFGGKRQLLQQIHAELQQQGHRIKFATAATPQAAEWLAEWAPEDGDTTVAGPTSLQQRVSNLPLQVLQQAKTIEQLQQLGCRSLSDMLRLPRAGLARRFGPPLLQQLDRALGHQPDPRESYRPPLMFDEKLELPAELATLQQFWPGVVTLLERLSQFLQQADRCTRWIQLTLIHGDCPATIVNLQLLRATNNTERLQQLLQGQLERLALPAAVRELRLQLKQIQASRPTTSDGLNSQTADTENWLETLERLQLRIGANRVRGMALADSHQPEQAWRAVTPTLSNDFKTLRQQRPNWLLDRPDALSFHHLKALTLSQYPERISGCWWETGPAVTRDYFIVQQPDGSRDWVYRSQQHWFRHGRFS